MSDNALTVSPVQEANALLSAWGFGDAQSRYHTSITGNTPQDQASKLTLLTSDGIGMSDVLGKQINVIAYLLKPTAKSDPKSGEVMSLLMLAMLLDDGRVVNSFSPYVIRTVLDTASMFGQPSRANPFAFIPMTRGKPPQQSHYLDTSPMTSDVLKHGKAG